MWCDISSSTKAMETYNSAIVSCPFTPVLHHALVQLQLQQVCVWRLCTQEDTGKAVELLTTCICSCFVNVPSQSLSPQLLYRLSCGCICLSVCLSVSQSFSVVTCLYLVCDLIYQSM